LFIVETAIFLPCGASCKPAARRPRILISAGIQQRRPGAGWRAISTTSSNRPRERDLVLVPANDFVK
jgi:hypothetical protein